MDMDNEFWKWVEEHGSDDPKKLWLKYGKTHEAQIVQVECRRRFGKKLEATLRRVPHWLFPSKLAGEQSTGDRLAAFHARLVPEACRMADLTAGLGIDALHCAGVAAEVTALEIDPAKADALRANMAEAGVGNVRVVCADCREWLEAYDGPRLDMVFIDPARRAGDGGRVFALADCEPDVTAMLPLLRRKAHCVLLKMSPMLDIASVMASLPECVRVWALGTPTECKELVALVDFEHGGDSGRGDVVTEAVTIGVDATHEFRCTRSEEMTADAVYGRPRLGDWLCEPYPAVMKIGAVRLVAERFGLQKLAANTHAYFAPARREGFPGEQRRIVAVLPYASKVLKRFKREYPRCEVAVRNFGISAEALRAKLGTADGAGVRVLGVTDIGAEKLLVVTESADKSANV